VASTAGEATSDIQQALIAPAHQRRRHRRAKALPKDVRAEGIKSKVLKALAK
jgi:hypothetical protein